MMIMSMMKMMSMKKKIGPDLFTITMTSVVVVIMVVVIAVRLI